MGKCRNRFDGACRGRVRQGVRLGIDVGAVRVGVARCDPSGLLASPVETIQRRDRSRQEEALEHTIQRIAELTTEHEAIEVVMGMPTSLSGSEGPSAQAVREFAAALAPRLRPIPVRLVDERFSTSTAERTLQEMGVRGRARRNVVDREAAAIILQSALDTERSAGNAPGEVVQEYT